MPMRRSHGRRATRAEMIDAWIMVVVVTVLLTAGFVIAGRLLARIGL